MDVASKLLYYFLFIF